MTLDNMRNEVVFGGNWWYHNSCLGSCLNSISAVCIEEDSDIFPDAGDSFKHAWIRWTRETEQLTELSGPDWGKYGENAERKL